MALTADKYRERAEENGRLAKRISDPEAHVIMLRVAEDYE
jgi:hypothetical protein